MEIQLKNIWNKEKAKCTDSQLAVWRKRGCSAAESAVGT
jgi:hypothetical protein